MECRHTNFPAFFLFVQVWGVCAVFACGARIFTHVCRRVRMFDGRRGFCGGRVVWLRLASFGPAAAYPTVAEVGTVPCEWWYVATNEDAATATLRVSVDHPNFQVSPAQARGVTSPTCMAIP